MAIILKVHKLPEVNDGLIGTIKITPEAEITIKELRRQTGLSGRQIASELIIQAAREVEIVETR